MKDKTYYSRAGLKARGWTPALIRAFLPACDQEVPNPHYRSAAPMKLYAIPRVETAERLPEWEGMRAIAARRQEQATKAAAQKRELLCNAIAAFTIPVHVYPPDELMQRACDHYNQRQEARAERTWRWDNDWEWSPATPDSDPPFLERITVNFLRHACTRYEQHLDALYGKVGVAEGKLLVHAKVLDAISAAYPALAEECARQLARKKEQYAPR